MDPVGVEPVNPAEGGQLDVLDRAPRSRVGAADQFGLGEAPEFYELGEAFAVSDARELAAGIGMASASSFRIHGRASKGSRTP